MKESTNVNDNALRMAQGKLIISFLFSIPIVYLAVAHYLKLPIPCFNRTLEPNLWFALSQFLFVLPVIAVNASCFVRGGRALFRKKPTLETFVAIGAVAAITHGMTKIIEIAEEADSGDYPADLYFASTALTLSVIMLGTFLESMEQRRAAATVARYIPGKSSVSVIRNGDERVLTVQEILPGDIVMINPGQIIPVDGIIVTGTTSIDASALTGESMPSLKIPGDRAWCGTVNLNGYIRLCAEKSGNDTTIEAIAELVQEGLGSKSTAPGMIDRASGILLAATLTAAVAAAAIRLLTGANLETALTASVAVLIVSCPCGLGIAAPAAIISGLRNGARRGIIVKSAKSLEIAQKVDTIILNKTGAIMAGKNRVTDIITLSDLDDIELLLIAATIQKLSELPLAAAIVAEAAKSGLKIPDPEHFRAHPGKGVEATIKGRRYFAGGPRLLQENGIDVSSIIPILGQLGAAGKMPFSFGSDGRPLGVIAVADAVKHGIREYIQDLNDMSIEVIMFAGESESTAEQIRKATGIQRIIMVQQPGPKAVAVETLKAEGKTVAMVGEGIGDAAAIAKADIGMVIGKAAELTIESADILLPQKDISGAIDALRLGKSVHKNTVENMTIAITCGILGIPVAAGAFIEPFGLEFSSVASIGIMTAGLLLICLNALRLNLFKK